MADYYADVKKYDSGASEELVAKLVKRFGIVLRNRDAANVSCTDPKELATVRENWMKKKLGMRALLNVIPIDASLVKGSHGRDKVSESEQPVFIGKGADAVTSAESVYQAILQSVQG